MEKTTKKVKKVATSTATKATKKMAGSAKKTVSVAKTSAKKVVKKQQVAVEEKAPVAKKVAPKTPAARIESKPQPAVKPVAAIAQEPAQPVARVTESVVVKKQPRVQPAVNLMHGVGRRQSAIARVWLKRGRGELLVNDRNYVDYFTTEVARLSASHPFRVISQANNYDARASVRGGGIGAQADAVKVGIARALVQINSDWRPALRQAGLLTVDARRKERKKYGRKAARRRFQFVKR